MTIEHIALYVKDLEAARDFFQRYLDASSNELYRNPETGFSSYFLSFDAGARLELMSRPGTEEQSLALARTGYIPVAFRLGSADKVDELTARLKADGYPVVSGPRTTGDGYYESCVIAIEGNQIELTV